jgi:UDP-N-acetylmuramoyl-tripeptide--D-alanyl-D-alanine ligase
MQININLLYNIYTKYPIICTDTRNIKKNSLFFGIKGENFDGNKFASVALKKGAAFAIIDEKKFYKNKQYILVDNVLQTLQELAKYHRKQLKTKVIGITGTNGKTSTKELINVILSKKYKTIASFKNLNNHIGVPLSVLSITPDTEIAVIEMGANHIREIKKLCGISQPDFGIITNIGIAHLQGFKNIKGIINAKNELFNYIKKNNGIAFANINSKAIAKLSEKIKKITYGTKTNAYCYGKLLENNPYVKIKWNLKNNIIKNKSHTIIQSQLIGEYNLENIIAAIAIGSYFDVTPKNIKNAIENYKPVSNRSQLIETAKNKIILDAYNANPTSMKAAIKNFKQLKFENKIVIIGDMLELGNQSIKEHKKILTFLEKQNFNKIILIGKMFSSVNNNNHKNFPDVDIAGKWLEKNSISSASILIKASRGIKLEKLIKVL